MKRFVLAGIAAAGVATLVSAAVSTPMPVSLPGRSISQKNTFIGTGNGKQLALEAMENLTPGAGAAAPRVTFAVRSFGPESDMLLPADAAALEDMAGWQLQILDRNGGKVGFIQGRGQPPSPMLSWSGLARNGEPFPGGFYAARFVWLDRAKKVYATRKVRFALFTPLKMPKFADLRLDLGFVDPPASAPKTMQDKIRINLSATNKKIKELKLQKGLHLSA